MSKDGSIIKIIAYQKNGKPISEGEEPEEFEFCCWDKIYTWLGNFKLYKCKDCEEEQKENENNI